MFHLVLTRQADVRSCRIWSRVKMVIDTVSPGAAATKRPASLSHFASLLNFSLSRAEPRDCGPRCRSESIIIRACGCVKYVYYTRVQIRYLTKPVKMYYRSGTDGRCYIFARQMLRFHSLGSSTALCCLKGRHGCHFEIITSNQESDLVIGCVFTWRTFPVKFHTDTTWNEGAFFEEVARTIKRTTTRWRTNDE